MTWRSAGLTLLVGALLLTVAHRLGPTFREAVPLFRRAEPASLALAALSQFAYYFFAALVLRGCLHAFALRAPFLWTIEATFLLVTMSRILPGPGVSGPAVIFLLLTRRGCPAERAASVGPMFFFVDYAVYGLLLTGSLLWLSARQVVAGHAATPAVAAIWAVALLFVAAAGTRALLRPARIERILERLARGINGSLSWCRLPWRIGGTAGAAVRATLEEVSSRLNARPSLAALLVLFGTLMALSDAASMLFAFRAFGAEVAPGQAVVAYSLSTLGALVSVLPAGLGTFDAAMALAFSGAGLRGPSLLAGIATYRALATLLPAAVALLAMRRLVLPQSQRPRAGSGTGAL
jgi:uncharacterized protein (TIRG00374 family)